MFSLLFLTYIWRSIRDQGFTGSELSMYCILLLCWALLLIPEQKLYHLWNWRCLRSMFKFCEMFYQMVLKIWWWSIREGILLNYSWNWGYRQLLMPDVGARNQTLSLCKSNKCSYLLNHLSSTLSSQVSVYRRIAMTFYWKESMKYGIAWIEKDLKSNLGQFWSQLSFFYGGKKSK